MTAPENLAEKEKIFEQIAHHLQEFDVVKLERGSDHV